MADFSGLDQQQAIAAQIPYKNMAMGNPAETFLNAWTTARNVKLKEMEYKGKLASLMNQSELDRAKFGLAMQKMGNDYDAKMTMAGIAAARQNSNAAFQQDKLEFMARKMNIANEGKSGLLRVYNQLSAEGISPDDPRYLTRAHELMMEIADDLPNTVLNKALTDFSTTASNAVKNKRTLVEQQRKSFLGDIGRKYMGGNPLSEDLSIILNPNALKDETTGFGPWEKPTGYKTFNDPSGQPRRALLSDLVADSARWRDLQQQQQDLDNRSGRTSINPMPARKEDLRVTELYDVHGQTQRWDGSNFVDP